MASNSIYDWRREGIIDLMSEALSEVSGVPVERCRADYEKLSTRQLEATAWQYYGHFLDHRIQV